MRNSADQTQRERLARFERDLKNATPAFDAEAYRPAEIVYNPDDYMNAHPRLEPATEQYLEDIGMETSDAESGTYRLTTGQFLLASIVVCMGAIAFVL